jgi:hypothetical protein
MHLKEFNKRRLENTVVMYYWIKNICQIGM